MPPAPLNISDAEWQVMEVIWDASPVTANEVVERLNGRVDWSPRTIKTLLNRLLKKGVLGFELDGKRYLYRPLVSRESTLRAEGRSFLSRVFGGETGAMLVHFVKHEKLSPAEIRELRKLLDDKEKR